MQNATKNNLLDIPFVVALGSASSKNLIVSNLYDQFRYCIWQSPTYLARVDQRVSLENLLHISWRLQTEENALAIRHRIPRPTAS